MVKKMCFYLGIGQLGSGLVVEMARLHLDIAGEDSALAVDMGMFYHGIGWQDLLIVW